MELPIITLAIGLIIFFAYLFSAIFEKYQIPDVLFLLLIGLVLGPITQTIDVEQFGILGNLFATLTLIIILFNAGLSIRIKEIISTAGRATLLMFATLILSTLVVIPFGMFIFGLALIEATLVGLVVGGVSAGLGIPLINKLSVTEKTKTLLTLESNINDIVSISIFLALLEFLDGGTLNFGEIAGSFLRNFIVSVSIGVFIALIWSQIISRIRRIKNNIFMTPALVLIVFGITELVGMSGMIAVFAFSIALGNLQFITFERMPHIFNFEEFRLTKWEKNMFSGFVFLLKTYFFIFIGLSIALNDLTIVAVGAFVTILLFVARALAVKLSIGPEIPSFDKEVLMKLVPKGLVGAALVTLVSNPMIQDFAYSMILFSIVFTSILIPLIPKGKEESGPRQELKRTVDASDSN